MIWRIILLNVLFLFILNACANEVQQPYIEVDGVKVTDFEEPNHEEFEQSETAVLISDISRKASSDAHQYAKDYVEEIDGEEKREPALVFSGCREGVAEEYDPVIESGCFTNLMLWQDAEGVTDKDAYIQSDPLLSLYIEENTEFADDDYNGTPIVYTPDAFNCVAEEQRSETCIRKHYLYFLENGDVVRAQLSWWPYEKGKRVADSYMFITDVEKFEDILLFE